MTPWLHEVSQRFGSADSVAAGVAKVNGDGTLKPSAALDFSGQPLLFVLPKAGAAPSEVVTAVGTLSGKQLPLEDVFADGATREALQSAGQLLIAFSAEDIAVLRSVGLPVAPAWGLDRLTPSSLRNLSRLCGWRRSSTAGPDGDDFAQRATDARPARIHPRPDETAAADSFAAASLPLTLVAWSPAQLRCAKPAELDSVVRHLRLVKRHLDIQEMDVGIWTPSTAFVERLGFRLQFDASEVNASDFLLDIDEHSGDALSPTSPAPTPPRSLAAATEELHLTLHDSVNKRCTPERLLRAHQAFNERLEAELLQPLLRGGGSAEVRNLRALLKEVSGLAHRLVPLINAGIVQRPVEALIHCPEPVLQLNQLDRLVQLVITLTKETKGSGLRGSCKQIGGRLNGRRSCWRPGSFGSRFNRS